ncbi:MAG: tRNA (adenosine(37)-N6)-threonylcarbamoyltransferase complex dimerization subunit type 1 TsaB [Mitsuaria chitosanitabida]|uniref:tRNA (adenosine(37)-N6)-threonylcarbamoyltransferase complex dimerization subunit type 1 TsaB n=1 Tax=Roseateles chitosanitabidus TaxID=65048 RepID=UPI001B20D235|nr:tRNA (adenosine(37)-N6)-threonylcarbamoyltransferase complex dimerization subunit type 1 TsaB [Roseateles chitosanitabidus]MBO9689291.1 tRNA (adenosine(37)-N6)-threonylcarbamoyltransferase complex dimerization subunit type 1 TsaB [Roseateles chitosanitabidus]
MSVLLALDSSTEHMALALVGQGHDSFVDADGGALASQRLVPDAMALLRQAGVALAQVDAIAFGRGPGAFTGLRTACSVAQGLAFGAGRPVLPLDSLMLVAEDARQQCTADGGEGAMPASQEVWVAMDARMNQAYVGRYRWTGARWETLFGPALTDPEPLRQLWRDEPPSLVAGTALSAFDLDTGAARRFPRTASRARALGALAQQAFAAGLTEDAAHALPLYVRDKVALTTAEREQARAAPAAPTTPEGQP